MFEDIHQKKPKEIKKRIEELRTLLQKEPQRVDFLLELSSCLRHLNDYEETIKIHDRLLALEPENFEFQFMKGIVLFEGGRFTEALLTFDQLLEREPENRDVLFNKALVLKKLDQPTEAKKYMKKALLPL